MVICNTCTYAGCDFEEDIPKLNGSSNELNSGLEKSMENEWEMVEVFTL